MKRTIIRTNAGKDKVLEYVSNIVIVLLVVANLLAGSMIYFASKPKCICDDCSRIRVSGTMYCNKHTLVNELICDESADHSCERVIWLEVKNRN